MTAHVDKNKTNKKEVAQMPFFLAVSGIIKAVDDATCAKKKKKVNIFFMRWGREKSLKTQIKFKFYFCCP